jgi:micrococcal nuclease
LEYKYNVKIKKIVDGDTVDVDIDLGFGVWLHKERVRIMGIDTPESRTSNKVEKVFGLAAKAALGSLLPVDSMQVLVIEEYDAKGKFGRILGDFEVGDKMATEILVEQGHCVAYFGGSKEEIAIKHIANRKKLLREGVVSQEDYDEAMKLMEREWQKGD